MSANIFDKVREDTVKMLDHVGAATKHVNSASTPHLFSGCPDAYLEDMRVGLEQFLATCDNSTEHQYHQELGTKV